MQLHSDSVRVSATGDLIASHYELQRRSASAAIRGIKGVLRCRVKTLGSRACAKHLKPDENDLAAADGNSKRATGTGARDSQEYSVNIVTPVLMPRKIS